MKIMNAKLLMLFLLLSTVAIGQNKITGKVYDQSTRQPVEAVVVGNFESDTETDSQGRFELILQQNEGTLDFIGAGYASKQVNFSFNGTEFLDLGIIYLETESLEELVIFAKGVIDVAEDRKTPIAVSTINRDEIEEKTGGRDITAAMLNTPSVYVTSESSGFGDTQMFTRGFDQSNTAFLLNGQPINGMEDGNMYWSNWSGMADIANTIQIQRGLGSSKLAISSVGGTINFITKATEMKPGGFISGMIGNDAYYKTTVGGSTGLLDSGFGVTAMFTHWQGDGYNDATEGQGQNYFISLGYKVNDKHNLNFLITGAPQWHNQNYAKSISSYLQYGRKYNNNWGYLNGEAINDRKNYYHKPVMNLNWDWVINERSSLSTVLYASWGRGGGTGPIGRSVRDDETGLILFDDVYAQNQAEGQAGYAIRASVNNHQWFGMVSNFSHQFSDELSFNAGIDLRTYKGDHFRQIVDLMGADYVLDDTGSRLRDPNAHLTKTFSTNPWKALGGFAKNPDEKYGYDYSERISYAGAFTQMEYATDRFSAFFQGALSNQSHIRWDYYQYMPEDEESEKVDNVGYNVKGGLSYNIDNAHYFFGNTGYYSRQPFHDNIYMNYRNDVNPFTENEKILGLELGYKYVSNFFTVNVNAYKTTWENRVESGSNFATEADVERYDPNGNFGLEAGDEIFFINRGVKQDHKGVEVDFQARPTSGLYLNGYASLGSWKYVGSSVEETRDVERNLLASESNDLDGGKVGNAAQTTFGLGAKYIIVNGLSVDANFRYYSDLYANRQEKDNLKLPSYNLVDAGVSYNLPLNKTQVLSFRFNVNNLFNTIYLSQSNTAQHIDGETTATYKGVDVRNQVYFGYGRTWNFSAKFSF